MTYTLLQVRDILRAAPDHGGNVHLRSGDCTDLADAIDFHLSQPQPVAQEAYCNRIDCPCKMAISDCRHIASPSAGGV